MIRKTYCKVLSIDWAFAGNMTICTITAKLDLSSNKGFPDIQIPTKLLNNRGLNANGKIISKGIAVKHPDDEYNQKIGKDIAKHKAYKYLYKEAERYLDIIDEYLYILSQKYGEIKSNLVRCYRHEQWQLNKIEKKI